MVDKRILVVEDSAVQAELLRDHLLEAGYDVAVVGDGQAALDHLTEQRPDAIVSDVMMPRMNGYELCRQVKSDDELADIPVILLTSLRDPQDIVRGLECQADNFLIKPYEPEHVLHRLDTVLRTRELRAEVGRFRMGVEVTLLGHTFTVSADRQQILDMLMASFEDLVNTNDRLREREEQLRSTRDELQAQIALADQHRRELEESKAELRHTLEATGVATWRVDIPDGRMRWSENARDVLGLGPEVRLNDVEAFLADVVDEDQGQLRELLGGLQENPDFPLPDEWEFRIAGRDGVVRTLSSRGQSVRTADDGEVVVTGVTIDITRRRGLEDQLTRARDEAERANRAKSEYLSRMSHELRTPMNSVLGFAQLLEMSDLAPDDRDSVDRILRAGRHLLRLIDDVLDIARIEAGRMTVSLEPVSVGLVVDSAVGILGPQLEDADLTLRMADGVCHDRYVVADQQRLSQVLINLLSNAIKYNERGGTVAVDCAEISDDRLRISVADTGPGISVEEIPRLFQAFDRLEADRAGVQGSGLGLALSKSLMEAMGGRIGCDSTVGEGSTFWIELPRTSEADGRLDADRGELERPNHRLSTATILYIEDNPLNLELVSRALASRPDTELLHAETGTDGLAVARQHLPDLILLDLQLPGMSGRDVLRELRTDPATQETPVIVLSADATTTSSRDVLEAGADDYLTKPIDLGRLRRTVERWLLRSATPSDTATPEGD